MQHASPAASDDRINGSQTRWLLVWALIFAGVVAAFQIGKAPIAIPLIRHELGLSLTFASWVIGVYAVVGAIAGLPAGLVINFVGARRCVIIGLLVIGAASCSGAFATSGRVLLLTRVLEGTGFLMVAVATPTLLGLVTATKDRDVVFGCWAVYFSAGSVIVMLAGPLLAAFGWRSLWFSTGLLALAYAVVVWSVAPVTPKAAAAGGRRLADIGRVMRAPGPILLALVFGFYSLQYHALTGLLPTLLVERLGLSVATAGVLSAVTIIANGLGGVSAGFLLRQGVPLWAMVAAGFAFMGTAAFGIFGEAVPVAGVAALATASLGITGILPASIYAAAPRFAPHPAMLALTVGIVVQASHLGHVLGPSALGAWVESFGWSSAPALFVAMACAGIAVALGIRRLSRARAS
jgi:predicted MFS family arabinose efflux permease